MRNPEQQAFAPGSGQAGHRGTEWLSLVVWAALALSVLELVLFVAAFIHGLSTPSTGAAGVPGGLADRLGLALFTDLGATNTLALVLATSLAVLPLALGRRLHEPVRRAVTATLALVLALGILYGAGSVLGVWARLDVYAASNEAVTTTIRYSLFSYLAGTFGAALIALCASLVALSWQRRAGSPRA